MSKFNVIHVSPVSVTIEIVNTTPFYAPEAYDVLIDGEISLAGVKKNVCTVYDLEPGKEYSLSVGDCSTLVNTPSVRRVVNVKDLGIANDGESDVTDALQKLFDEADHDLIVFDAGVYKVRPLSVYSNTYVYLKEGAELRGSTVREEYPIVEAFGMKDGVRVVNASWEGTPANCFKSLISIVDSENIEFIGKGHLNGNANNGDWWLGNVKEMKIAWRGNNVFVNRSRNVTFAGLTIENSPAWNVHPFYSDQLKFIDLVIRSYVPSPNTDGFDPESCDDVLLCGSEFFCGDDCVAIKSGKACMNDEFYRPCTNLTIRNCLMNEGHGGVVFGSESSCGIYDVTVSQCIFDKTDRGLRIKTKRGRGDKANVGNVVFDNIEMRGVKNALVINMYYFLAKDDPNDPAYSRDPQPKDHTTPHLGTFNFRNMKCYDTKISAGYFYGLPESKIDEIRLENIEVTFDPSYTAEERPAMLNDCEKLNNAGYYFYNVENVYVNDVKITGQKNKMFNLNGVLCHNIKE